MELVVNGERRTVDEPASIADLLRMYGVSSRMVVVERNRAIVPRDSYAEVILQADDEVEIVQMMAGG